MKIKTGHHGVVVNVGNTLTENLPGEANEKSDPVSAAKAQTAAAMQAEEQVTQAQEMADQITKANECRTEAKSRSKKAFNSKANGTQGRKMHQTAALAHEDAAGQYKKIAGANSGHDLDTRAKAKEKANDHADMADKHRKIAEGVGMLKRNQSTGSKTTVCNVASTVEEVMNAGSGGPSPESMQYDQASEVQPKTPKPKGSSTSPKQAKAGVVGSGKYRTSTGPMSPAT